MYNGENIEPAIRFPQKSLPSDQFQCSEISQIKAKFTLHSNMRLYFDKNTKRRKTLLLI